LSDKQPCKVCTDAKTSVQTNQLVAYAHSGCPLTRNEVGRASWGFLHTLAAYYPDRPSLTQQEEMRHFLVSFSRLYPCGYCADRTIEELERNPPRTDSRPHLALWLCSVHNEVNDRLGKPLFDCQIDKLDIRWRHGHNHSCDIPIQR